MTIVSFPGLPSVQFFNRLQYAKMEEGVLVHFITRRQCLQSGGGVPHGKNELEALSCSFCPKLWICERSRSEKHTTPVSKQRTHAQMCSFDWGPPPT